MLGSRLPAIWNYCLDVYMSLQIDYTGTDMSSPCFNCSQSFSWNSTRPCTCVLPFSLEQPFEVSMKHDVCIPNSNLYTMSVVTIPPTEFCSPWSTIWITPSCILPVGLGSHQSSQVPTVERFLNLKCDHHEHWIEFCLNRATYSCIMACPTSTKITGAMSSPGMTVNWMVTPPL